VNGDGITYSRTYTTEWGEHGSEYGGTKSMQLSDFDTKAMKSSSRVTKNEL
jgi:hypothetical protein